jgi:hypothetical protein
MKDSHVIKVRSSDSCNAVLILVVSGLTWEPRNLKSVSVTEMTPISAVNRVDHAINVSKPLKLDFCFGIVKFCETLNLGLISEVHQFHSAAFAEAEGSNEVGHEKCRRQVIFLHKHSRAWRLVKSLKILVLLVKIS